MIRVLPTMAPFRYCHTCPRCGSHAVSFDGRIGPGSKRAKLCSNCGLGYTQEERAFVPDSSFFGQKQSGSPDVGFGG